MKKLIKILAITLGSLIALVIIAAIAVTLFFDPNDYRQQVTELVEKNTGRKLAINGEIELSLFPWIGVGINQVELGNAPGFKEVPFAKVEEAQVRIKLLPLLKKQIEMDTIVLNGMHANLMINSDGVTNWDDLAGAKPTAKSDKPSVATPPPSPADEPESKTEAATTPKASPQELLAGLAIGGAEIHDGQFSWEDKFNNQSAAVNDFNLTIGAVALKQTIPLELSFRFSVGQPKADGLVNLKTTLYLDLETEQYRLTDTRLEVNADSPLLEAIGGSIAATLLGDIAADLKQQTASVNGLSLATLGTTIDGNVAAKRILGQPTADARIAITVTDHARLEALAKKLAALDLQTDALKGTRIDIDVSADTGSETANLKNLAFNALGVQLNLQADVSSYTSTPKFDARISTNTFSVKKIVKALNIELPEMADKKVLEKVSMELAVAGTPTAVTVSSLKAVLDDTTLSGTAAYAGPDIHKIRYDITMDGIDVDRYLPPPPPKPTGEEAAPAVNSTSPASPGQAAAAATIELPNELLRSLDIDGTFRLGKLKVMNLKTSDIRVTVVGQGGKITVHPLTAKLYQGSYSGNITLDARKDTPVFAIDEKLTGIEAEPLLKDFLGEPYVSGKGDVAANMTTRGNSIDAFKANLNGNASFRFLNGAVNGINIAAMIRKARGEDVGDAPQKTDFAELSGSATAKNGVISNNDLSAKTPLLRIGGEGTVDLNREKLNYLVKPKIVGSLAGQGGDDDLNGLVIPVRVTGTFQKPEFNVDLAAALDEKTKRELEAKKQQIQQQLEAQKREAQQQLEAQKQEVQKRLEAEKARKQKELEEKAKKELEKSLKDAFKF